MFGPARKTPNLSTNRFLVQRGWTGGGGTGKEGAESGVEGAESGVEGAGSGSRVGGKRERLEGEIAFFLLENS